MKNKSMIRSQECDSLYSIFLGEFFKISKIITKDLLGVSIYLKFYSMGFTSSDIKNNLKSYLFLGAVIKSKKI